MQGVYLVLIFWYSGYYSNAICSVMSRAIKKQEGEQKKEDVSLDILLRPSRFSDYIGQETIKNNIRIILEAAKQREEVMDHLLLYGQAGLGKTTLASIIAKEMNAHMRVTSGPVLEKTGDLAALLSTIEAGDILFIDEAHRINRSIEEMLYPAMESRQLHLIIGKGPAARMMSIDLPPFTLVAATTRVNMLSAPLRSRFGGVFHLDYYTEDDMKRIIERSATLLGISIDELAVDILARASRFTPRIANRLLKRVRDLAQVAGKNRVNESIAQRAMAMFEIDDLGLEAHDRKLLRTIIEKFGGRPVGIGALAAAMEEDRGTIEDVFEPFLLKLGLLARTSSGRVVTEKGREHIEK